MFAVMVAGRLPQVDFQTVDSNKYLITIPDADSINFLVVFMTGSVAFPPGEIDFSHSPQCDTTTLLPFSSV